MDNSNQNPNTPTPPQIENPVVAPPPPPVQPVAEPVPPPPPPPAAPVETTTSVPPQGASNGNKLFIAIGVVLILGVVIAAGVYLFTSYTTRSYTANQPTQAPATPTLTPSPTPASPSSQLENIDVGNPESDLNSINQDVNQL